MTSKQFITELTALRTKSELENVQRYFSYEGVESKFLGVRMANIFALAKKYMKMHLEEVEKLLEDDYYEARVGAVSIMDFQAREKKITLEQRKALFDLYISRHDRINNWDMVDRSAPYVVGGYLADKPRKILYTLAKSKNVWERRTAIVATYYFIRQGDIDDTFKIAEILFNDKHELINKAVGSWVREAGKRDKRRLITFLDKNASTMPRTTLRYAIEKLSKSEKDFYMNFGKEKKTKPPTKKQK
ncbi:MAG: DNA alkylation repair protein [Chitinophagaceae bacterium]|nr:DNA alkylation repair protein [Chitinophagaceae bacterium]